MPSSPIHSIVPPVDDSDIAYPTYNVLVMNEIGGSLKKVMDVLSVDLSKIKWAAAPEVNMFNVSIFTERESTKLKEKESETFHVIEWKHKFEDCITPTGPNFSGCMLHENDLID